jgi:RecB family exonuclease
MNLKTSWAGEGPLCKTGLQTKQMIFIRRIFLNITLQMKACLLDDIPLSGKIDRIVLNPKKMTATVIDFKTGQPYGTWQKSVPKLHQYRQQLMIYKILIENSKRFAGYTVNKGIIGIHRTRRRRQFNKPGAGL